MSIIDALVKHNHSHESELFTDVMDAHNATVTSLESQLANALAVIAKKDEALIIATTHMEMYSLQISHANDYKKITEAIDLNLGDVTLVEVGSMQNNSDTQMKYGLHLNDGINPVLGTKLYKIQTKE